MLERDFQRRLLSVLKAHEALREAAIFKHSDRFHAGIPDFSVTVNGKTTWWELKCGQNRPTKLQMHYIVRLHPVAFVVTALDAKNYQISSSYDVYTFEQIVTEIVKRCLA